MKTCKKCGVEKSLSEFDKNTGRNSHRNDCKQCKRAAWRKWRIGKDFLLKAKDSAWYDRNKEWKREYNSSRKLSHPHVFAAYNAVAVAERAGRLVRPAECEICGQVRRLHAHHYDYSKPLDVKWVCSSCHRLTHERERTA